MEAVADLETTDETTDETTQETTEETTDDLGSEFETRVNRLMEMIDDDPAVRDRMICEIYTMMSEFSNLMRGIQSQLDTAGGPRSMLKMIFGG